MNTRHYEEAHFSAEPGLHSNGQAWTYSRSACSEGRRLGGVRVRKARRKLTEVRGEKSFKGKREFRQNRRKLKAPPWPHP